MLEKCKICKSFCPQTRKDRHIRLRAILMELALRLASEPRSDSAPSTTASTTRTRLEPVAAQHQLMSLVPKKHSKKGHAERGCSPVPKLVKRTGTSVRPASGYLSPSALEGSLAVWELSPAPVPLPTLGSVRGPLHLVVPIIPEAFQTIKNLLAALVCLHLKKGGLRTMS